MWHAAILGDTDQLAIIDADNFRTKAAKEAKAEAEANGKIPVTAPQYSKLEPGSARIRQELKRFGIIFDGAIEDRLEWEEETTTGATVQCSGVLDHWCGSGICDLKTGSEPVSVHKAIQLISSSHALLQDAAYKSALQAVHGIEPERNEFIFAFVQTQEPFSVTPVTLGGDFRELSALRWQRAVDRWSACLSKGTDRKYWPGPVDAVTPISAPGWMMSQEIELEAMSDE